MFHMASNPAHYYQRFFQINKKAKPVVLVSIKLKKHIMVVMDYH